MKTIIYRFSFLFVLMLIVSACVKEEFELDQLKNSVRFSSSMAVPIGFMKFQLDSMLNNLTIPDHLEIHSDGTMTIRYRRKVFSDNISDLFAFPEIIDTISITNSSPTLDLDMGMARTTVIKKINFCMNDTMNAKLYSVWINTLLFNLKVNTIPNLSGTINISSKSFIKDDKILNESFPFDGSGQQISLDGYTIFLENNQIILSFGITINPLLDTIPEGEELLSVEFSFSNVEYEAIFGFLGNFAFNLPTHTMPINFFNSIIKESIGIENPLIKICYSNSIGIPLQVSMEEFYMKTRDDNLENITGAGIPTYVNPRPIRYPDVTQIGASVTDSLILNWHNTNLLDILLKAPKELTFSVAGEFNPPGIYSTNFITKNSKYSADVEVVLPLKGYASLMTMMDTLEFDFTTFWDRPPEELKRLIFRLNLINGFPVELDAQMYFADENYTVLDSLFSGDWTLVKAGVTTGTDCDIEPFENDPLEIEFPGNKIDNISKSKYIFIYGRISTLGWENKDIVTFCINHTFEAFIGVIVEAEFNLSDH